MDFTLAADTQSNDTLYGDAGTATYVLETGGSQNLIRNNHAVSIIDRLLFGEGAVSNTCLR